MIFSLHRKGISQLKISKILNAKGVKTKTGKKWYNIQVGNILACERLYRGEYRYGKDGDWVKGQQDAILAPKNNY
jgi:hypothetical protein